MNGADLPRALPSTPPFVVCVNHPFTRFVESHHYGQGEESALREQQGGHIVRAEPEGVAEWRVQGGKHLAAGGGVVVATAEGEIFAADEAGAHSLFTPHVSARLKGLPEVKNTCFFFYRCLTV